MKESRKSNDKNDKVANTELTNRRDSNQDIKQKTIMNLKINHILKFNLIVHNSTVEEFNIKAINDIIYNENKRIVSKFKDHLIYNDPAEFFKSESSEIITQWGSFFDEESLIKLVPNYSIITTKKLLLRNIRKKLKLREKLRRTYYDENDEYEGDNIYNKSKPAYSRFFLANIDLKESLQEKSTIDLNFGLVDDSDRSRFFNMNNYTILNTNYEKFNFLFDKSKNKNLIPEDTNRDLLEDSFENFDKTVNDKFKKHFYDNEARYIFSTGIDCNFIQKNILKNFYKNKSGNIDDFSEMQMDFTKSKISETSSNSNSHIQNHFSFLKNESLVIEDTVIKKAVNNDFMNEGGGVYEIKYNENKKINILKISEKNLQTVNEPNDFFKNAVNNDNVDNNNIRGIYNNFEFENVFNFRPSNLLNNIITSESMCLKDDVDFNYNFVLTNYEDKNDLMNSNNIDREVEKNLRSYCENKTSLSSKISRKTSDENENLKENLINKTPEKKIYNNNQNNIRETDKNNGTNVKPLNSFKAIQEDPQNCKNNSIKKYETQKSLERNQSTKNLLLDTNHLRRLSKDYDFENNELNFKLENDNTNKLFNKETENNYYNIQTRKSLKKNNDMYFESQKPKFNLYSNNNKFKKNANLDRNISGSPNNRLNNLNNNDLANKNNYRYYYESKLYKEQKDRNAKHITNRNRITEKEKNNNKNSKNNLSSKSPFKLAPEHDSNRKKKTLGLNRIQSVQDLLAEKMKIDKSIFDSKEKKSVLLNSKSLIKINSSHIIQRTNSINRISDSNKYIDKKFIHEGKKSPFPNEFNKNLREGSYTTSHKTILNNNNNFNNNNKSYCESKNQQQIKEKNNDSKVNISNNKINKQVTKFKSNPKIENRRNLNIHFSDKWNSSSNLFKSSSAAKITQKNANIRLKGNSLKEKENLDASNSFYKNYQNSRTKNNQSKLAQENHENNDNIHGSQNAKVNNFGSKHRRTYSDFLTPSPILKNNLKAISTTNLKNIVNNNLNSNTYRVHDNWSGKYNNSKNNFYLGDHKNIQSEKTSNKGRFKIFETNNFSKQINSKTYNPNNYLNFSNLNSKEEDLTIQRDEEFRNSNNFENNIVNKNIINNDLMFKNIPVFENIEAKQKLLKQNSIKNSESNNISSNLANVNKNSLNNQESNKSEVFFSPKKGNIESINDKENLKRLELRRSKSNTLEEKSYDFNKTINKYENKGFTAAYSNLDIKNLDTDLFNAKMLNINNKLDIPNLDSYINSPSAKMMNKELSINLLSYRKENSEIPNDKNINDTTNSINNKIRENINDVKAIEFSKNKRYKIIDTVHLNKFLNSRSNNYNINSLNIKAKTFTIANFVSISSQENMKINLNKNETSAANKLNNSRKLNNQNSITNQINSTPIKQKKEDNFNKELNYLGSIQQSFLKVNENKKEKNSFKTIDFDADIKFKNPIADYAQEKNNYFNKVENKEKLSFYKLAPGNILNSIQNLNNNNHASASCSDVNNFNKNFNPNNFKNSVFFIGASNKNSTNSTNNLNSINNEYIYPKTNNKDDCSNQELKIKKSESSNFNSKTTKLNENSSIENCLQITADNFSKKSYDNASSIQMKNSFNNFALSNIIQNEISENKSSNASKINLLSVNSKNKDSVSLPFKIENNSCSFNNSKITSNSLNSFSNNSNNRNSNFSNNTQNNNSINKNENDPKEGIFKTNLLAKKIINSNINNFNKNNAVGVINPYFKGNLNSNYQNENLLKNFDEAKEESNNLSIKKSSHHMHKKTKSSDFNTSKEKYSNKFINTNSNNINSNKNPNYKNENNGNSNKNFVSNNLNNYKNRNAIAVSASTNIDEKHNPNVFISTNIPNKSNTSNNNTLNPRHRKNSYSHAFISYEGNQQNNNAVNIRNTQNIANRANLNNYNKQTKVKVTAKIESKEKERIILNFSSNNSSNLNFNNLSKNLNENSNHLLISTFGQNQRNSSSHSNIDVANKLKRNSNSKNIKK